MIAISGIIYKTAKVALPRIKRFGNAVYDTTLFVNIRSLFCRKCAKIHRTHSLSINIDKINEVKTVLKKVDSPVKRVDTPITRSPRADQIPEELKTPVRE